MKKIQSSSKLWIFFVVAILVPAVLLGYFAVRTVEQEEAVLERHWKESLTIEVFHIGALIRQQLVQIQRELDFVFTEQDMDLSRRTEVWREQSGYIDIPFVLSAERYFLWPHYTKGLSTQEWVFIKNHFDFFKDRQTTPAFDSSAIWKQSKSAPLNPNLDIKSSDPHQDTALTFSEVIQYKPSGIIPQMIDNKLHLIYWKKLPGNEIAGCLINQDFLMTSLLGILPRMYSESRALNILNETGRPFYGFKDSNPIDWQKPFLAIRISDQLPFWRVAAYLTDPTSIQQNARSSALLIWIMISILILTILTGGYVIIKTLRNQIESAQQKTAFAANVSHELRTPVTSIKMFIEMLQGEDITPDKQREYLGIINDETDRLNHLIKNVLDFSRSKERVKLYTKKVLDMNAIVSGIVERYLFPLKKKGFQLDYMPASGPLLVSCDKNAILQVISNLIDNAVKYSDTEKRIEIRTRKDNSTAIIEVEDSGIGIKSHDVSQIFEAYYRADDKLTSRTQGTGLGLTIADQIIRDHQGKIIYKSKARGSIFQIELPLDKG